MISAWSKSATRGYVDAKEDGFGQFRHHFRLQEAFGTILVTVFAISVTISVYKKRPPTMAALFIAVNLNPAGSSDYPVTEA